MKIDTQQMNTQNSTSKKRKKLTFKSQNVTPVLNNYLPLPAMTLLLVIIFVDMDGVVLNVVLQG